MSLPGFCTYLTTFEHILLGSAPLLFFYAYFQSSFTCIYCQRHEKGLNMAGRGVGEGQGKDYWGWGLWGGGKLLAGRKPIS